MSEEITVQTTYDVPGMLTALRWHHRLNLKQRFLRVTVLVFVIILTFLCLDRVTGRFPMATFIVACCALAGGCIGSYARRSRFIETIKSSPSYGKPLSFSASEQGVKVTSAHANGNIGWGAYYLTVATSDGVLLYPQKNLFNWLPKAAFTSEADYTRFLDLLAAKTKHTRLG